MSKIYLQNPQPNKQVTSNVHVVDAHSKDARKKTLTGQLTGQNSNQRSVIDLTNLSTDQPSTQRLYPQPLPKGAKDLEDKVGNIKNEWSSDLDCTKYMDHITVVEHILNLKDLVNQGHKLGSLEQHQINTLKQEVHSTDLELKNASVFILRQYQSEQLAALAYDKLDLLQDSIQNILATITINSSNHNSNHNQRFTNFNKDKKFIDPFLVTKDLLTALNDLLNSNKSLQKHNIIDSYIKQITSPVITLSKDRQQCILTHLLHLARIGYEFEAESIQIITDKFLDNALQESIDTSEFLRIVTTRKKQTLSDPAESNIQQLLADYQDKHQDAVNYALNYINGDNIDHGSQEALVSAADNIANIVKQYKGKTKVPENSLIDISKILLSNVDQELRKAALEVMELNKNNLPQHVAELITIEKNSNDINKIKVYVKDRQLLTTSCFEILEQNIFTNSALDIINNLLDNDQQQLPKSLVVKLFNNLNPFNNLNLFNNLNGNNTDILTKIIKQGRSELPDNLCQILLGHININSLATSLVSLTLLNAVITKDKSLMKSISDQDISNISTLITKEQQLSEESQNVSAEAIKLIIQIAQHGKHITQAVIEQLYNSGQENALKLVADITVQHKQNQLKYEPYAQSNALINKGNTSNDTKYRLWQYVNIISGSGNASGSINEYGSSNEERITTALGEIKAILNEDKKLPDCVVEKLYQVIELYSGQVRASCIPILAAVLQHNENAYLKLDQIMKDDTELSTEFISIITASALRGNINKDSFNILLRATILGNESIKARCQQVLESLTPEQIDVNIPLKQYLNLASCQEHSQIKDNINLLINHNCPPGHNVIKCLEELCTREENLSYVTNIVTHYFYCNYNILSLLPSKLAKYMEDYVDNHKTIAQITPKDIIDKFFEVDDTFNELFLNKDNEVSNRSAFDILFPDGENKISDRLVNAIEHAPFIEPAILKNYQVKHWSHKILSTSLYLKAKANHISNHTNINSNSNNSHSNSNSAITNSDTSSTELELDEYLSNTQHLLDAYIDQDYLDYFLIELHKLNNMQEINHYLKKLSITTKVASALNTLSDSAINELSNYLLHWDSESIEVFLQKYKDNNPQEFLAIKNIQEVEPQIIRDVLDTGIIANSNNGNNSNNINKVSDFIKAINKQLIAEHFNLQDKEIAKLVDLGYTLKSLQVISNKTQQAFSSIIDLILDYSIELNAKNYKQQNIIDIVNAQQDVYLNIGKLGLEVRFSIMEDDKDLDTLLKELAAQNSNATNSIDLKVLDLEKQFIEINNYFAPDSQQDSQIKPANKPIKDWEPGDIKAWSCAAKSLKNNLNSKLIEVLAVIKRANILDSGQDPRIVHVLSLLLMLQAKDLKGILAQIATGEGKTSIVSMLAVISSLKGQKVDIITSSSILASEGVQKKASFYKLFDLTVGDNGAQGQTGCYTKDIVYGSISNFQFDFLRDQYMLKNTRQGREFDVIIADEVDSMLIDEGSKIAMLSEHIAGMEYLESLLAGVFATTTSFLQGFIRDDEGFLLRDENNNAMFIDPTTVNANSESANSIGSNSTGTNSTGANSTDTKLDEYIPVPDQTAFIVEHVKEIINQQFFTDGAAKDANKDANTEANKDAKDTKVTFALPANLKSFAKAQTNNWIDMSLVASQLKPKVDYLIQDNAIKPIDYDNTGIIQTNTQWQNGLHQFLQIKHGLKMSPESFTTCFISNVGYFKQYKSKIYGVTGTLGSQESKALLTNIYQVDCLSIPTYKPKQFLELTGIIANTHHEWLNQVATSVQQETAKGRGVLVICKTIDNVDEIIKTLVELKISKDQIIRYANNEADKAIDGIKITSGQIIVATNLAGRGTDINTDKIEAFGGLHVCLTFMPNNLRVEEQAFGRTARQGNKGTGQLIIHDAGCDIKTIKTRRNAKEVARLQRIETKEITAINIKDKLFLGTKDQNTQAASSFTGFMSYIASIKNSNKIIPGTHVTENDKYIVKSIEERWGLFFAGLQLKDDVDEHDIISKYNQFIEQIKTDLSNDQVIKSHCYRTLIGNKLCDQQKYEAATDEFNKAIRLDPLFAYTAHYNKAYAIIKNKGNQQSAKDALVKAKTIITDSLLPQLQALMAVGSIYNHDIANPGADHDAANSAAHDLTQTSIKEPPLTAYQIQFNTKIGLLEQHKQYIEEAIKVIENKKASSSLIIDQEIPLEEMYSSQAETPTREIAELRGQGFSRLFTVKEKPPTDWFGIIGVFMLGALQTIAGAALSICGFVNIGSGLIGEGIADFIAGIKSAVTGGFHWTDYLKDKAMSLAISVTTMGMSAIKSAIKVAKSVTATLKQIGTQCRNGAKSFFKNIASKQAKVASTQASKTLNKEGVQIILKTAGKEFAEQGAQELINLGMQAISKELLAEFETKIINTVKDKLKSINTNPLEQILTNQSATKNLENAVSGFLSKQSLELQNLAEQFVSGVANGVSKKAGAAVDILRSGLAISETTAYVAEFVKETNATIVMLSANLVISIEPGKQVAKDGEVALTEPTRELKTRDIQLANKPSATNSSVFIEDYKSTKDTNDIQDTYNTIEINRIEQLKDNWSQQIASKIINIIQGKILNPLTNKAISRAIRRSSEHVQKTLSTQGHTFNDKLYLWQNKKVMRKATEQVAQGYDKQIKLTSDVSLSTAYSQKLALRQDREGGMFDVGALAAHLQRPIHIYKDGKPYDVIGKGDNPIKVDYTPPANGQPGHWHPHGQHQSVTPTGKNNCLFDAVGSQLSTKLNGQELRQKVDEIRIKNTRSITKAQESERCLLQNMSPDKAKGAIMMGGAWYCGTSATDAERIIDASQDKPGHAYPAKGHPRGHASDPRLPITSINHLYSVENYSNHTLQTQHFNHTNTNPKRQSKLQTKTGFLSRAEQNQILHFALRTQEAQWAMCNLNSGSTRAVADVPMASIIPIASGFIPEFMNQWRNSRPSGTLSLIRGVKLVLQHHQGQQNNPLADVHMHTAYPYS